MSCLAGKPSVVKRSASMVVSQAAKAQRAAGVDKIDLAPGEPDFQTPVHIISPATSDAPLAEATTRISVAVARLNVGATE
jgi:aspartate aminotransferase